jgi:inorganic triphosphatase YgiF
MILYPDYEHLITIIKKVISTNGYLVEQKKIQHIEDNYFDTKDGILGKRKFELRLRVVDKNYL